MCDGGCPEPIVRAVQTVARLSCVDSVEKAIKHAPNSWRVSISIRRSASTKDCPHVPPVTTWCAIVESSYPGGRVDIYPSGERPIEVTFPHQLCNESTASELHRSGKLCLLQARLGVVRSLVGADPVGDTDSRLSWHVARAHLWLDAACRDTLMNPDEPFELPHLPRFTTPSPMERIVHEEGPDTYDEWQDAVGQVGEVELRMVPGAETVRLAARFNRHDGELLRRVRVEAGALESGVSAFWWFWPQPIVLAPWHAPQTWGELRRVGVAQGVKVDRVLKRILSDVRPGAKVIVLLGYPIPERWHGRPVEMHWQALYLRSLPTGFPPHRGFRDNPDGRWRKLRDKVLGDGDSLGYVRTANWHPARLQARGRIAASLRSGTVCIIGAGALGAAVADLLARGGCEHLLLIDGENLEVGNLVRHQLTVTDLGRNKAEALAERLRTAAPMATIDAVAHDVPLHDEVALEELLNDAAIVCDCTAENAVIDALSHVTWMLPKVFLSASLGQAAQRLFLFATSGQRFDADAFWEAIRPWSSGSDDLATETVGERLEGAGCWSPLFPARGDDVWLAAATSVRYLEHLTEAPSIDSHLRVFEQVEPPGCGFTLLEIDTTDR